MTADIKRILVPLDFSANSKRALDYAHGLARKLGAALHLVHVCELPTMMSASIDGYARGAPCPVLTVREPREREVAKGTAKKLAVAGAAAIAALLLIPAAASAQEFKQTTAGAAVYSSYCAVCHGTAARGDGPLAASMKKKPANLTEIAQRNGGTFPSEMVFRTIDGRQPVRGHGGPDMPVWGDAFAKSREAGDTERVKAVIQSLVEYLESIQLRPSHEQQH